MYNIEHKISTSNQFVVYVKLLLVEFVSHLKLSVYSAGLEFYRVTKKERPCFPTAVIKESWVTC